MPVKQVVQDAFEQVVESGQTMAKSSVKQVASTFNPWDMIKNSFQNGGESSPTPQELQKKQEQLDKQPGSTPLDFQKLQKNYAEQDKHKIDAMKNRLFQMVKGQEERQLQEGKRKKLEQERQVNWEEDEKKRRAYQEQQRRNMSAEPQGKERGSILGGKKKKKSVMEPQPAELKPTTGHQ